MNTEELAQAIEEKRPEMIRIISARMRYHGLELEAEDIVQDAIVNMLEYTTPIRLEEVPALFHTICARLAYNRIGQAKTHIKLNDEHTRIYRPDSQAQMRQRERLKIDVDLALASLPARTSQVVRLVWMEDCYWSQAAKELKCSKRDIQAALEEALPILRLQLARYDHRRRAVSASQPPYKEETSETDTASPDGGHGDEMTAHETNVLTLIDAIFTEESTAA